MEAKSTESGSTKGIKRGIAKSKNLRIIITSNPFPASSDINNQTV